MLKCKNFAKSTLAGTGLAAGGTSFSVASGQGSKFDTSGYPFIAIIWGASYPSPDADPNAEVIWAKYSSGDSFTVVTNKRGQEGTTDRTWASGSNIANMHSAGKMQEVEQALSHGQCRLTKSGANLLLSRYNGRYLLINGSLEEIPSSGITLAATGLTAGTNYYIYAYMSSGTMTLEASTTTHAADSTTGVEIKSGDATRTLVGLARAVSGPAWQDDESGRYVLSYFNRKEKNVMATLASSATTTSATYVEASTALRAAFLTWGDEIVDMQTEGFFFNNSASAANSIGSIGVDGTTPLDVYIGTQLAAPFALRCAKVLSEGYHYTTPLFCTYGGSYTTTLLCYSDAAGYRSSNQAIVRG